MRVLEMILISLADMRGPKTHSSKLNQYSNGGCFDWSRFSVLFKCAMVIERRVHLSGLSVIRLVHSFGLNVRLLWYVWAVC